MGNQTSMAQAAALAGASTNARVGARMEGRALTDRASNSLAGYPAMGMAASGISIANTGLAGLNSGAGGAAQVAGQMGANAGGMYGTQGNLYANTQKQDNTGAFLGAGAGIAAAFI